jgi:hypothetical protein
MSRLYAEMEAGARPRSTARYDKNSSASLLKTAWAAT